MGRKSNKVKAARRAELKALLKEQPPLTPASQKRLQFLKGVRGL